MTSGQRDPQALLREIHRGFRGNSGDAYRTATARLSFDTLYHGALREAGHDPDDFTVTLMLHTCLADTRDGKATLLENTMVFFGSGMGNASSHSNRNLPVLVAGGGFQHGRSLKYEPGKTPLCNLYVTMLQRLGIETGSFGNGTSTLTGFA